MFSFNEPRMGNGLKLQQAALFAILFVVLGLQACAMDPARITRPANSSTFQSSQADLEKIGAALWRDPSLSSSGEIACFHCHVNNNNFGSSFAKPYPHHVDMPGMVLNAEQMVQFCILMPMERSEALAWDSKELAALTAYTEKLRREFAASKGK